MLWLLWGAEFQSWSQGWSSCSFSCLWLPGGSVNCRSLSGILSCANLLLCLESCPKSRPCPGKLCRGAAAIKKDICPNWLLGQTKKNLKNLYIELNFQTGPAAAIVVLCQSPLLPGSLQCHSLCHQGTSGLNFLQLLVRDYSPGHAFPPWENWQYQIRVHHSKVKQKWRGDQRLSTAASFNEDCRGEK